MIVVRMLFIALLFFAAKCSAQSAPKDPKVTMEHAIRSSYKIPSTMDIAVGQFSPSPDWQGYDVVKVTISEGDRQEELSFLVSKDRTSMFRLLKYDLSKDPFAELMKKIDLSSRPIRGSRAAKVILVVYDDFECPFCSRLHQTLFPQVLKEYGDRIGIVYKDYPLPRHPWAYHAATNGNCLAVQSEDAYWNYLDYIHANQQIVNSEKTPEASIELLDRIAIQQGQHSNVNIEDLGSCLKAQNGELINRSVKEGEAIGVEATPTLFINGQKLEGAVPIDQIRGVLDHALIEAGLRPGPAAVTAVAAK